MALTLGICSLLFFFLQVSSDTTISARLLQFMPFNVSHSRSSIQYSIPRDSLAVEVDAAYRTQVSIFAASQPDITSVITIHCYTAKLSANEPISYRQICRKQINDDGTVEKNAKCEDALNGQVIFGQFLVIFIPDGIQLIHNSTSDIPSHTLSGSYFCKLKNSYGVLQSNWFRIVDALDKQKAVMARNQKTSCKSKSMEKTSPIEQSSLPVSFECCQEKINVDEYILRQPQYGSLLHWTACRAPMSIEANPCIVASGDVRKVYLDDIGEYVVLPDGTLWLLSFKIAAATVMNLVCYSEEIRGTGFNYYRGSQVVGGMMGFRLQPGLPYDGPIERISSEIQNIMFEPRKMKNRMFPYQLIAIYKASNSVDCVWKKDNESLPGGFTHTPFKLEFPEVVNASLEGMYSLWLNYTLYFQYNVSIITIPYFLNAEDIVRETFVLHGGSVSIVYNLSHPGDKKTIFINGNEIPYRGSNSLQTFLEWNPESTLSRVRQLKVELSILDGLSFENTTQLQYRVFNLQDPGGGRFCQSHTFSMYVENAYGGSRIDSFIKVLPNPKPSDSFYPEYSSCNRTQCSPNQNLTVNCKFPLQYFSQEGARPVLLWYLDGRILGSNMENFSVSPNNTDIWKLSFDIDRETLFIWNITASVNRSNVTCRLLLLHPDIGYVSDYNTFNFSTVPHLIIFDSNDDSYPYKYQMTAEIFFTDTNSLMWIVAVVLVILALIVPIILYIYYVRRRVPKITYEVDAEERKQGHDPLKEMRDDTFHDYERGDGVESIEAEDHSPYETIQLPSIQNSQ